MRVVFDTNVIVAALRSPLGASAELLRRSRRRELRPSATVALCLEYESVCLRPEHVLASGMPLADVLVFIDAVIALSEPVDVWFQWRPQLRDAGDELVLEAAVNGRAEALVTFNIRDFTPECSRFGLKALTPATFLRSLA